LLILLVVVTAVLAACSGGSDESAEEAPAATEPSSAPQADDLYAAGSEYISGQVPPPPDEGAKVETERETSAESEAIADTSLRADTEPAANSRLTAGEVDDNAQWDDYLLYLRDYDGASVIRVDVSERHQILVQDSQQRPILGAAIAISANNRPITTLRTFSNGRVIFHPHAYAATGDNYTLIITVNNAVETLTIPADTLQREWVVTHPGGDQLPSTNFLDVLFLLDATGSMSDEINQLKGNIHTIAAQIEALPAQPSVRFGLVIYRDQGDAFLTQVSDFTPDVDAFAEVLAQVQAEGGGDYPEDLNTALTQAIHDVEWRVDNTVSLIFLVADAPPHLDYGQENHYTVAMRDAVERGLKIYPIASSGLDEQGEYVLRQLAQFTNGRFLFLTYGESGPGTTGTQTDLNVSDYIVSALDQLVVNIVTEELTYLVK
jgi:hypothetical protein